MIDFGDGGDGRLAAATGYSLFDRDAGRQAFDGIDIRLFELFHKLPCIRRHTVQKRRWPSANKMSKASVDLPDPLSPVIRRFLLGDVKRHILEIVFTCPRSRITLGRLPADTAACRLKGADPRFGRAGQREHPEESVRCGKRRSRQSAREFLWPPPDRLDRQLRTQIDDPIRALDHLDIVLNDNQTLPSSTRR